MAVKREEKASGAKSSKGAAEEKRSAKQGLTARGARTAASLKEATKGIPLRYAAACIALVLLMMFVAVLLTGEGAVPLWFAKVWQGLFGRLSFWLSVPALTWFAGMMLLSRGKPVRKRGLCLLGAVFFAGALAHMLLNPVFDPSVSGFGWFPALFQSGVAGLSGGVLCGGLAMLIDLAFGTFCSCCLLLLGLVLCFLTVLRISLLDLLARFRDWLVERIRGIRPVSVPKSSDGKWHPADNLIDRIATWRAEHAEQKLLDSSEPEAPAISEQTRQMIESFEVEAQPSQAMPSGEEILSEIAAEPGAPVAAMKQKVTAQEAAQSAVLVEQEIAAAQAAPKPEYCFPPIDLLTIPRGRAADGTAEMRENTRRLNETLASFKIEAHISNVTRGPSVTRYEVELEKGVRLNKLTGCADDIALSLGASGVRIAPVPGKISVVGIEVPNQAVSVVSLREVIDSAEFAKAKSHSAIAVGKDIGGSCIIGNIAKFPHMLIAGTTGSGKSVCMNSIIISLLYKSSPEDVKLIMVDPKMVELGIYNGIPHLLIPVVTDPKKAAGSLQWAVTEMMRRYRSMSDAGVRDLESYNSMIIGGEIEGEKLPQIVVIIDELADLMLVAAKEVEESICRIAQMGRAAGIHLIIATQRPSADVITGLMKANIPSRIAFSVASAMESRIILDTVGAEKLVGKGDMLYSPIGSGKPQRVQGCFVTDTEVEAVASYVKEHYATTYDQTVMDDIARKAEQTGSKNSAPPTASDPDPSSSELAGDEMLPDAVEVILETKQASVSMLQRRLKLGYARAARIVDEMEEKGIVGPFMGSKPRQILITKEQWDQMKSGQTLVVEPPFDLDDDPVPEELM